MTENNAPALPPFPPLADVTATIEEPVTPPQPKPKFSVLDQRYADPRAVKNVTLDQLAKIELEIHNLRIAYVVHGFDEAVKVGSQGGTIGTEMARLAQAIVNIEAVFDDVLTKIPSPDAAE